MFGKLFLSGLATFCQTYLQKIQEYFQG